MTITIAVERNPATEVTLEWEKPDVLYARVYEKGELDMAKFVVVKTNDYDPEVEATEFDNYREATAYLHWYWEDYYNRELAENPEENFISKLNPEECYHEEDYAKVQWDNGDHTDFNIIAITPKREGFPKDWQRYATY